MIYTSLAVLALSASALASPLSNLFHFHPKLNTETRVSVLLVNKSQSFRDVKVAGHSYTVLRNQTLYIKAPVGTVVYADSSMSKAHRGDALLELTPQVDNTQVALD